MVISSLQSGISLGKAFQLSLSKADGTNNFSAELKSGTYCITIIQLNIQLKMYTNLGAVSFKGCGLAQDR